MDRKPRLGVNTQRIFDMDEKTFQKEVDLYFTNCDKNGKTYLMISLANHLKLFKDTMYQIREDKLKCFVGTHHSDILKIACQLIESNLAEKLFDKTTKNIAGTIFALKCNFNWSEKQQIDLNHGGKINIKFD